MVTDQWDCSISVTYIIIPDNDSDEVPDTSLPFPEQEQPHEFLHKSVWNGFKIVGDNIDKSVRPSFQRAQHQTKSLHYFNSYAVRDRVDCTSMSDADRMVSSIDAGLLLVTEEEWNIFKDGCGVLISRYVCCNFTPVLYSLNGQNFGFAIILLLPLKGYWYVI